MLIVKHKSIKDIKVFVNTYCLLKQASVDEEVREPCYLFILLASGFKLIKGSLTSPPPRSKDAGFPKRVYHEIAGVENFFDSRSDYLLNHSSN